jgi:hypothetical protein
LRRYLLQNPMEVTEQIMREDQAARRNQRRHAWLDWVSCQRARSGGTIHRWAQRSQGDPGLTLLLPSPEGHEQTNASRVEKAAEVWGALWKGGQAWHAKHGSRLPPITGEKIRQAFTNNGCGQGPRTGWMGTFRAHGSSEQMA